MIQSCSYIRLIPLTCASDHRDRTSDPGSRPWSGRSEISDAILGGSDLGCRTDRLAYRIWLPGFSDLGSRLLGPDLSGSRTSDIELNSRILRPRTPDLCSGAATQNSIFKYQGSTTSDSGGRFWKDTPNLGRKMRNIRGFRYWEASSDLAPEVPGARASGLSSPPWSGPAGITTLRPGLRASATEVRSDAGVNCSRSRASGIWSPLWSAPSRMS